MKSKNLYLKTIINEFDFLKKDYQSLSIIYDTEKIN